MPISKLIPLSEVKNWETIQKITIDFFGKQPNENNFYSPKEVDHNFLINDLWVKIDPTTYTEDFVNFIYSNFNEVPKEVIEEKEDSTTFLTFEKQEVKVESLKTSDATGDKPSVAVSDAENESDGMGGD